MHGHRYALVHAHAYEGRGLRVNGFPAYIFETLYFRPRYSSKMFKIHLISFMSDT